MRIMINLDYLFNKLTADYFCSARLSAYASTLDYEEVAYTNLATAYEDFKEDEQILNNTCRSFSFDVIKVKSLYRCFNKWRKKNKRRFPLDKHYNKILIFIKGI